jgi:hypothetical protein
MDMSLHQFRRRFFSESVCTNFRYLGAKLQYGHIPLYVRGGDDDPKHFGSLHAVQRHMIDSGRCFMVYDENEDEYDDYYEYPCASFSYLSLDGFITTG